MSAKRHLTVGLVLLAIAAGRVAGVAGTIAVWPVDPHAKVFRDAKPAPAGRMARLAGCRAASAADAAQEAADSRARSEVRVSTSEVSSARA